MCDRQQRFKASSDQAAWSEFHEDLSPACTAGNKKPSTLCWVLYKELGDDLLSHTKSTLSLAQVRFTALFEMGRGGSKPLLSPNITGNVMHGADALYYMGISLL